MLSLPEEEASAFAQAIVDAKAHIHCCPVCACTARGAVLGAMPPSTSSSQAGLYVSIMFRTLRMVSSWDSRKACPPKLPGRPPDGR